MLDIKPIQALNVPPKQGREYFLQLPLLLVLRICLHEKLRSEYTKQLHKLGALRNKGLLLN